MKKSINLVISFVLCLSVILITPVQIRAEDGVVISKDGVPISYSIYGQGEPTLIFVHGWSCNRSFWKKQIPYFEKKYRGVTLDLAGHGTSGRERNIYSLEAFGEDVAAVIEAIDADKVILIGHSMGGAVIIETAEILPEPVIALIGIDTMQNFEEESTPQEAEEFIKPFKEDFKKTTEVFARQMFLENADPEIIDEVVGMMSGASPEVGISAMEEMVKTSYIANPPKIKVPIWCLNSELWPTKPEINRKYVPEFNLHLMPGVGHFLMLESPDEFNTQLDDIIKEIIKNENKTL